MLTKISFLKMFNVFCDNRIVDQCQVLTYSVVSHALVLMQVKSYLGSLAGLFAMIDQRRIQCRGFQSAWVHCPTCRIRTDFGNIAYVDDGQQISSMQNLEKSPEDYINVQGSYSTKVKFLLFIVM